MPMQWEFGAPVDRHCCSVDCPEEDAPATWTWINPTDGGWPLYYCQQCKDEK